MNGFILTIEDHATLPDCEVQVEIDCTNDWYVHTVFNTDQDITKAIYADADLCDIINYKVRN